MAETLSPKVSVCIVTMNHERFIEQCVRSALDQLTDFDFEVIVGDDCSTDRTPQILKQLEAEYAPKLKVLLHERNLNGTQNYFSVHNMALGQYVAHLDGDDYWLPGKLQRMTDLMEKNPDVNVAWHRVYIEVDDGTQVLGMPLEDPKKLFGSYKIPFSTLIRYYGTTGQHSASIYRRSARKVYAREERTLDYFHSLSLCEDGFAMYVPEPLGIYRFYKSSTSLTTTRGAPVVGYALLNLQREYLRRKPEYKREIVAQAIFEGTIRGLFGFIGWREYFKLAFSARAIPRLRDLYFIARVFNKNRHSVFAKRLEKERAIRENSLH